jgi:phosphatidate cytidylyltransferase
VNGKSQNLVVRILSAALLLPLVVGLLVSGLPATAALVAVVAAILTFELYRILFAKLDLAQYVGIVASACLPVIWALWPDRFAAWALGGFAGLLMVLLSYYLLTAPHGEAPARVALTLTGVLYCGLLVATAVGLRALPHGLSWLLLALLVTWSNDTGAYLIGRCFGRHKLYDRVSPSKTWEGFLGGSAASIAAAFIARLTFFPALGQSDAWLVAVPASLLGPLGDLSESMLKRAHGVKDSGKLMPGHGGLLDRVDAILFSLPYVYLYALCWNG